MRVPHVRSAPGAGPRGVSRKVDVIVATTGGPIAGVKRETRTIPIVMVNNTDPVGSIPPGSEAPG
jgi:ABC-type uncharacterized transport system substrate-binding protein